MGMRNILVIEDEPSVAIALRDSLESEGYQVQTAKDGSEGLRLASVGAGDDGPELIILDLMLPKISGLEVCQRLRRAGVETPVIMLTARGAASDAAFGLKLGADDYIPKPFDVGRAPGGGGSGVGGGQSAKSRSGSNFDRRCGTGSAPS